MKRAFCDFCGVGIDDNGQGDHHRYRISEIKHFFDFDKSIPIPNEVRLPGMDICEECYSAIESYLDRLKKVK